MEVKYDVHFYDYNRMKKILKDFDPELRKAMDREIRGFLKPLAAEARGIVPARAPVSNWGREPLTINPEKSWSGYRRWDAAQVASGISVRQGGKRFRGRATVSMWRLTNRNAAGAIYELAGRRSRENTPQGEAFIRGIEASKGHTNRTSEGKPGGRLIWRVYERAGGDRVVAKRVIDIAERYEQMLERAVNERGRLR
jgi:hypothetical protein